MIKDRIVSEISKIQELKGIYSIYGYKEASVPFLIIRDTSVRQVRDLDNKIAEEERVFDFILMTADYDNVDMLVEKIEAAVEKSCEDLEFEFEKVVTELDFDTNYIKTVLRVKIKM